MVIIYMPRRNGNTKKTYKRKPKRTYKAKKTYTRKHVPMPILQSIPEKKTYTAELLTQTVGQVDGNSKGYYIGDTSPDPNQGTGSNERVGNKIAVVSGHWSMQFYQQSSTVQPINGIVEVFYTSTPGPADQTTASELYNATPFILSGGSSAGIIDYNSSRDYNYMKNYKRVCYKKFKVWGDTLSSQVQITSIKMGFKVKNPYIFRISDAGTQTVGQFIIMVRLDAGNLAGGASTLTGIPIQTAATGVNMLYYHNVYYYDS